MFNKDLDKTSAETAANYTFVNGANNLWDTAGFTASLQSDNRTVILTAEPGLAAANSIVNQSTNTTVTVANIKAADGTKLSDTVTKSNIAFTDVTVPTVVKAEQIGSSAIRVYFSEPVVSMDSARSAGAVLSSFFQVDNGAVAVTAATANDALCAVDITTGSDLTAGAHTVVVNPNSSNDLRDYVGYSVLKTTQSFTAATPSVAPVATVVKATPTRITVHFDRAIHNLDNATKIYATYDTITPSSVTTKTTGLNGNNDYDTDWNIDFASPLTGNVNLVIDNTNKLAEDRYAVALAQNTQLAANVVADTAKPVATKLEVRSNTQLRVYFDKDVVAADAQNRYNYTLEDSTGKAITTSTFAGVDTQGHPATTSTLSYTTANGYVDITLPNALPAGSYKLQVANIKDTVTYAPNTMDAKVFDMTVSDTSTMVAQSALYDAATRKVYLTFSKAVGASALDVANYQWDSDGTTATNGITALPAGSTIAQGNTSNQVVITLGGSTVPVANAGPAAGDAKIYASVQDTNGKAISPSGNTFDVDPVAAIAHGDVVLNSFKVLSANKVSFEVKKPLSAVDASKITLFDTSANLTIEAGEVAVTGASYENKILTDGTTYGAVVTLTTANNAVGTALASGDVANAAGAAKTNTLYAAGGAFTDAATSTASSAITVTAAEASAQDFAAPTIVSTATADNDGNGQIDRIVVTYSEAVNVGDVSKDTFTVDGYTVNNVIPTSGGASSTVFTLVLNEKGTPDTGAKPTVLQVKDVHDATTNANVKPAETSTTRTTADGAAPVIVSAARTGANALSLTFSEGVYATNTASGALAAGTISLSPLGTVGDTEDLATITITAGATSATATTTSDATVGTSTLGAKTGTSIYDAAGNAMGAIADGTATETVIH